ncbi:MAG: hypothetical protein LBL21_03865 [Rickettsiales bacterium]|jgi:hypothetical protein|nr:hypothetical protein [Rickettsiales bacterium]
MKTVSYKSEVLNYLHPEGVFGHLLDAMLYRRKIEFLQKIRTNIKRAGFNNTMALRFLGKMRARISGWRLMFKSKRMSMIEAHRNIEALVAASAWELEMPATGETRPAREKYSPPQNPRAFGRASENLAFATPHEWTRSIHSHLPAHKKGESYSSVEYGGAPKLKYDPNGRGE